MKNVKIKVLLVEDVQGDIRFICEKLKEAENVEFEITYAQKLSEALKLLETDAFDIILLDLGLPDSQGLDTFKRIQSNAPELPIVIIAGLNDTNIALKAIQEGAQDYILKNEMNTHLLERILWYSVERKQAKDKFVISERRFKLLYNSITEGVCIHKLVFNDAGEAIDYRIIDVNPSYERILGLKRDDVLNKLASDIYGTGEPPYLDIYTKVSITGEPFNFEAYFPPKKKHFSISAFSLGKDQFATVFDDITKYKLAEETILESESRYRTLVENSPLGIIQLDEEMRIIYENASLKEMFGIPKEETSKVMGMDIRAVPSAIEAGVVKELNKLPKGEKINVEFPFKSLYGKETFLELHGVPLFKDDTFAGAILILEDITERKRSERELKENQSFLNSIFESIQDGISVLDTDLTVRHVNNVMKKWYEANLPLEGKKCYECYHNRDEACDPCPSLRCIQSRQTEMNVVPGLPGSTVEWIELYSYPIIDSETGDVKGVVEFVRDITERVKADVAIKESEEKYRRLVEQSNDAIYLLYEDKFEIINQKFSKMFNVTSEEVKAPDFNFMNLVAPNSREVIRERDRMRERGETPPSQYSFTGLTKDGKEIELEASITEIPYKDGVAYQGILRDVTEQKSLEAQFRQSQKMEAVGRLAGGVAHDFNNLLTVIGGNIQLAMMSLSENDPLKDELEQVYKASERAAKLTNQLLAFSRRQQLQLKVVDLNYLIVDMEKMLSRIIGEDIILNTFLADDLWKVKVDSGQFEQILVNLCINARDAMPDGGTLTIETMNIDLTNEYARTHPEVAPGPYVMVSVSDNGCGMTDEIKSQIFDPFFTTKSEGKGTGLGLSTVYGIVKQSGGFIYVYSEPGEGTTFKIYLPRTTEKIETINKKELPEEQLYGKETILVVEDDESVRNIAVRILKKYGYNVIEAENGGIGYLKCKKSKQPIDLIITDVIMPEMNGAEFITSVKEFWPKLKVLYMSGYTYNVIAKKGIIQSEVNFISKPFRPMAFLNKVKRVLMAN